MFFDSYLSKKNKKRFSIIDIQPENPPKSFKMRKFTILSFVLAIISSTLSGQEPDKFSAMEWRFIGPVMGGRGTCVELDPVDDQTFYFGSAAGGVWKTEDAGQYWENITDGYLNVGAIGAMAIAPSKY